MFHDKILLYISNIYIYISPLLFFWGVYNGDFKTNVLVSVNIFFIIISEIKVNGLKLCAFDVLFSTNNPNFKVRKFYKLEKILA